MNSHPIFNDQLSKTTNFTIDPRECDCPVHRACKRRGEKFPFPYCTTQAAQGKGTLLIDLYCQEKAKRDVEMAKDDNQIKQEISDDKLGNQTTDIKNKKNLFEVSNGFKYQWVHKEFVFD